MGVGEATSTRGDRRLGPFGRFRPVGRFGPVGRRARTVASVRILTPGVVVLEDGVGLASSSSRVGAGDDGPGAEHAPRRSPRRRAGRGRDARRIEIAVVGESRAGFVVAVAVRRARFGSVDATREPGFPRQRRGLASVSIRAPGEGDGVAAATRGCGGGVPRSVSHRGGIPRVGSRDDGSRTRRAVRHARVRQVDATSRA